MIDWESVACCCGHKTDEIPEELVEIIEYLDYKIKDANGMKFTQREEFGLRSTQIIGIIVMLWEMGILVLKKDEKLRKNTSEN